MRKYSTHCQTQANIQKKRKQAQVKTDDLQDKKEASDRC